MKVDRFGLSHYWRAFLALPVLLLLGSEACAQPETASEPSKAVFRITPVSPIEEIREEALRVTPPSEEGDFLETDLIELATLDPTIQFDIRYSTDNNFLGVPLYRYPRAYLQRPAAEALLKAHHDLKERGLGLLIYDAYRPWFVTKMFWDATPQQYRQYVANPANGSRHNRGAAVDLTLYDLKTGTPLSMPSDYDEFAENAHSDYSGATPEESANRKILRDVMEKHGFTVYPYEWWHFDFQGWERYRILNLTFGELDD